MPGANDESAPLLLSNHNAVAGGDGGDGGRGEERGKERKEKVGKWMESTWGHTVIAALVLTDATLSVIDIGYDLLTLCKCPESVTFLPPSGLTTNCYPHSPLLRSSASVLIEGGKGGMREGDEPQWVQVLRDLSFGINFIFVLEHLVRLWASGWRYFLRVPHWPLHLLDAFVVFTTLILEIGLRSYPELSSLVALLVLLRLWRLIKVVEGVAISVEEVGEAAPSSSPPPEGAVQEQHHADEQGDLSKMGLDEISGNIEGLRKRCKEAEDEVGRLRVEMSQLRSRLGEIG